MTPLYERFRPTSLADVVGQAKAVKIAQRIIEQGAGGHAVMLTGPSGSGKTTIGRIIAHSIADDWAIEEGDASHFSAERLDRIDGECRAYGWGKGGRAYIVNECHGLRADQIRRLLVMLEAVPSHVVWVFTTTSDGADKLFGDQIDAGPLCSRCVQIYLTNQGTAEAFAAYAKRCADAAGMNGQPDEKYLALVRKRKGNLRAVLQDIQAGAMIAEASQ